MTRHLDDRVDGLEDRVLDGDSGTARRDVVDLRRELLSQRRVLAAQRDVLDRALSDLSGVPGFADLDAVYYRDVLEELRRLAAAADVFIPLTVLTGFFGMNFGWLVDHIHSLGAFIGLGIALPIAIALGLMTYLRRRGYLD